MVKVVIGTRIEYISAQLGAKPATYVIGRITLKQYVECYLQEEDKATIQL